MAAAVVVHDPPQAIFASWLSSLPSNIRHHLGFEQYKKYYVDLAHAYRNAKLPRPKWKTICAACVYHFFVHHTTSDIKKIGTQHAISCAFGIDQSILSRCWGNIQDFETERLFGANERFDA